MGKNYFLLVLCMCVGVYLTAEQGFYANFEIPVAQFSKVTEETELTSSAIIGVSLSYVIDIPLSEKIYLSTGAGFRSYGIEIQSVYDHITQQNELRFNEIVFPGMINIRISESLYMQAGGACVVQMNARNKFGQDISDYYRSVYPTANAGVRYFLTESIYCAVTYGRSMSDIRKDDPAMHVNFISMGVGIIL